MGVHLDKNGVFVSDDEIRAHNQSYDPRHIDSATVVEEVTSDSSSGCFDGCMAIGIGIACIAFGFYMVNRAITNPPPIGIGAQILGVLIPIGIGAAILAGAFMGGETSTYHVQVSTPEGEIHFLSTENEFFANEVREAIQQTVT